MPRFKDITGEKYGEWTVIKRIQGRTDSRGYPITQWLCRCSCGTERIVLANALLSGSSTSCGCRGKKIAAENAKKNFTTHGESKSRLYKIWAGMKKRCCNPTSYNYKNYGGRGIKICEEWMNDYTKFAEWSKQHGYRDDLSIDRIDVNGDYMPSNCRWSNMSEQANNRRSSTRIEYDGKTYTICELAKKLNVNYRSLHKQLHKGMSLEEALKKMT